MANFTEQEPHALCRRSALAAVLLGTSLWRGGKAHAWSFEGLQGSMQSRFGAPGVKRLQQWQSMLEQQRGQPLDKQLAAVNNFWNETVLAGLDIQVWKEQDYWATPLESLGTGQADCEDFVIGKYFSLRWLGVSAEQMRMIYVRARVGGITSEKSIAHMVLGFYTSAQAQPQVLDNLVPRIQLASQRQDLTPVFSFDAQNIYVDGAKSASSERINRWQNLLVRMRQEGFDV